MATYNFEQSGEKEFDLEIDKQNLYIGAVVNEVEKTQRPSDATPEYHFIGHNGNFYLKKIPEDRQFESFTTPYVLTVEGGSATAEIVIPEEFAMEIIQKITETGMVDENSSTYQR